MKNLINIFSGTLIGVFIIFVLIILTASKPEPPMALIRFDSVKDKHGCEYFYAYDNEAVSIIHSPTCGNYKNHKP